MEQTTKVAGLTPAQVEFFSSDQLVEFVPLIDAPAIPTLSVQALSHLLCGANQFN
jgi:hypothetical protein